MVIWKNGYSELLKQQESDKETYIDLVKWLQTQLQKHGYALKVDGIFGANTESSLKAFQAQKSFDTTGKMVENDATYLALSAEKEQAASVGGMLSEHFSLKEFRCKANGELPPEGWSAEDIALLGPAPTCINPELIVRLELLRTKLKDRPIIILSGYRTPDYNRLVGGVQRSQHIYAAAADIKINGVDPDTVANTAETLFQDGGIGRYSSFTHVDVRGKHARWYG